MMKAEDKYKRRHGPKQHASGGQVSLRQPSRQPDGSLPPSSRVKTGDVRDLYLRGQGDPYSMAHAVKKK
jgi:hypothetical protein